MSKLFFVCPFARLENLIQAKFGEDVCFLTVPGAVLQLENSTFAYDALDFIIRERVTDIYIVSDTSCIFINDILLRRNGSGHYAKQVIEEIYIDSYKEVMNGDSLLDQQIRLAMFNVNYQLNRMIGDQRFIIWADELKLAIHGIVTVKGRDQLHVIKPISYLPRR